MAKPSPKLGLQERLRAAPTFTLAYAMDGRAFLAKTVEPYTEFWLNERERALYALFPAARGRTVEGALEAFLRLTGEADTPGRRGGLLRTLAVMRSAGVLAGGADDTSRYDAAMAADYLAHRPIPAAVSDLIVREGGVGPATRVLDLAGGPGNLALPLAAVSDRVSMIELSRGFVQAARAEARRRGVALDAIHESCNRLASHEATYDVVTIAQALHWLDDVAVCRGLGRILAEGGSFFVVHSGLELDDHHPLSFVLGDRTPLGNKAKTAFEDQAKGWARRLSLLFDALDSPDVQRIDPLQAWGEPGVDRPSRIAPAGLTLFREERTFDEGFARAFLSPEHVRQTGLAPEAFWAEVRRRCDEASPAQLLGRQDWAVLHFRRTGAAAAPAARIAAE